MPVRGRSRIKVFSPVQQPCPLSDAEQRRLGAGDKHRELVDICTKDTPAEGHAFYKRGSTADEGIDDEISWIRQCQ